MNSNKTQKWMIKSDIKENMRRTKSLKSDLKLQNLPTPREMISSQCSTLDKYKEETAIFPTRNSHHYESFLTPSHLHSKHLLTRGSFLYSTLEEKKERKKKKDKFKVIERTIIPTKPGKGFISSPSDLINLNPLTRTCKCPSIITTATDYFDISFIEGIFQLYSLNNTFAQSLPNGIKILEKQNRDQFCCNGYRAIFVFFERDQGMKMFWKIAQYMQEGKINDELKVVVFVNSSEQQELFSNFDFKILVKPVCPHELKVILKELI